jgi:hypothetical protein
VGQIGPFPPREHAPVVAALMSLRGSEFVAAVTPCAELGDLARFAHPSPLRCVGEVPRAQSIRANESPRSVSR